MDMEKKAFLVNKLSNLSDSSPIGDWDSFMQAFGDFYKEEVKETLSGGALTTELAAADVDIASMIAEMDARTDLVIKPN